MLFFSSPILCATPAAKKINAQAPAYSTMSWLVKLIEIGMIYNVANKKFGYASLLISIPIFITYILTFFEDN